MRMCIEYVRSLRKIDTSGAKQEKSAARVQLCSISAQKFCFSRSGRGDFTWADGSSYSGQVAERAEPRKNL